MVARTVRPNCVLLLALAAALAGCARKDAVSNYAPAPTFQPLAESAIRPEDHSLTAAQYAKLGVPSVDQLWGGEEMAAAAKALVEIARTDAAQLPRYRSGRSGSVFSRITAAQNLDPMRDNSRKFDARFNSAQTFFESTNSLLSLYLDGMNQKKTGDSEMMEILGLEFRVASTMVVLVDELVPTIKPGSDNYDKRMAGLDKMKRGLATMVGGGLESLTERDHYRASERARLVEYMKETLPVIIARLTPEGQRDALAKLDSVAADKHLKELQPALEQMRVAVRNGVVRASTM